MEQKQSTKSKRMQLVIPEWLHDEIAKKADKMGVNVSEAVREAIREFVKK
jgi:metal-responsive CopG/Arc/MetJ family transcriptional regulator